MRTRSQDSIPKLRKALSRKILPILKLKRQTSFMICMNNISYPEVRPLKDPVCLARPQKTMEKTVMEL